MARLGSFGYLPPEYSSLEDSAIVILPVPYDQTSTWVKGADKGPEAIIEASGNMELYDIETDTEVYLNGIHTPEPVGQGLYPDDMVEAVREKVRKYIELQKFTVVIGGEHSVAIGAVAAHRQAYSDLMVLQLDAHADLRDEYEGSKYNHACVMARIGELCPIVQVGIRSMDVSEKDQLDPEHTFFAADLHNRVDWIEQVLAKLDDNVYITIDLDVLDPSIMPSTGTPEPGGLMWYELLALLRAVSESKQLVGFDVVELCPNERNRAPNFTAAKLVYKLLSYRFRGSNG